MSKYRLLPALIVIAALSLGTSTAAPAATMRCGDNIVQRGHTFFEVLERCGKPDLEYGWDHRYVPGVEARLTEWVYEQGSNKFRRILRFEEGRLRNIELRPKPELSLEN